MLAFLLLPSLAYAESQTQLQAAAAAHRQSAAAAQVDARGDAARAALLAEQQVQAAAQLRVLENQTGDASMALARLQAQAVSATAALKQNEATLAQLLPVMQRLSAAPAATILATPESPADSVRGILVLQGIASAIEARAEAVRSQSQSVATLLTLMTAQEQKLVADAGAQQTAEAALTAQIAAARGAELADRDKAAQQAAAAAADDTTIRNLQAMTERLDNATPTPVNLPVQKYSGAPVAGDVVEAFGDPTVAGPAEGITYRAAPGARVIAPCGGPVLFAGLFQSYGLLVIMDCGGGDDFVLSGMDHLDVVSGQRLAHGQPIGEMLGVQKRDPSRAPALYVELRQNGVPVDPAGWLANGSSG